MRPEYYYAHCIAELLRLGCATAALRPSLCALSGSFSHICSKRLMACDNLRLVGETTFMAWLNFPMVAGWFMAKKQFLLSVFSFSAFAFGLLALILGQNLRLTPLRHIAVTLTRSPIHTFT